MLRSEERQVLVKRDGAGQNSEGVESHLWKDLDPEVTELFFIDLM